MSALFKFTVIGNPTNCSNHFHFFYILSKVSMLSTYVYTIHANKFQFFVKVFKSLILIQSEFPTSRCVKACELKDIFF